MSAVHQLEVGYYTDNDTRYVFLDGDACQQLHHCFKALQQQLSIPSYFGHNLDALEEVLDDLDWIREHKIKIIVLNAAALLKDDAKKRQTFLDILHQSQNKKIEVIYLAATPGK